MLLVTFPLGTNQYIVVLYIDVDFAQNNLINMNQPMGLNCEQKKVFEQIKLDLI